MPLNYKNHLGVSTAVIAALSLSAVAGLAIPKGPQAADTSVKPAAPDAAGQTAQGVLAKMAGKYKGLKSYSADGSLVLKSAQSTINLTNKVAYKGNKVAVVVTTPQGVSTRIFDGKTLSVADSKDTKSYQKISPATPMEGVLGVLSQKDTDIGLLPFLLTDPGFADKVLPPNTTSAAVDPKGDVVDGVAVNVVIAQLGNGDSTFRFDIGKTDNLLRRVTITRKKDGAEVSSISSTYRNVRINPKLDDSLFVFTPAPGQVAQVPPAESPNFDPRLKTGANPLPFSGKDTDGKPLTLAQYKGKVVLVDFWATWCAPCIAEMPNVLSAYGKYKAKGFDIIGVSLDEAEDKPKLVKFAKERNMPWRQVFDGGAWDSKLVTTYGVKAIPFTLLIGKDGKIAAVNPRGSELEPAIAEALAAK